MLRQKACPYFRQFNEHLTKVIAPNYINSVQNLVLCMTTVTVPNPPRSAFSNICLELARKDKFNRCAVTSSRCTHRGRTDLDGWNQFQNTGSRQVVSLIIAKYWVRRERNDCKLRSCRGNWAPAREMFVQHRKTWENINSNPWYYIFMLHSVKTKILSSKPVVHDYVRPWDN